MRDFYRRWWCGDEPIMGMDLKDDVVLLAQSTTLAVARDPAKLFAIPLPSGVIEKGVVKDAVRLASIFRETHYLPDLSGCRCAVAIPSVASFTACLDIPDDMLFANLSEAYSWALNCLSLDASKLIGKAYLHNRHSPQKAQLFLVVARLSAKEILEETFQALGLELSCITLRSIALHKGAAIVSRNSRRPVRIWIDFTDRSPALHLFEGNVLQFSRYFNEGSFEGMIPLASEVCDELRKLHLSRYAIGEIEISCAGPEALAHEFKNVWKDKIGFTSKDPLSGFDIVDIQTAEAYQDQHLIATGLVRSFSESLSP